MKIIVLALFVLIVAVLVYFMNRKNQPKGLFAAALANMGERFGYYTMMAILTLFLMSQFNLDGKRAGAIYSAFLTAIYILSLLGGFIADKTRNYKGTIMTGLVVMAVGYVILAVPAGDKTLWLSVAALFIVAFGNGLFKGNLQALVGQLYDNPKYEKMRDSGFQLFYMFINLGAVIAPAVATGVRNGFLKMQGFGYNSDLSGLCHQFLDGKMDVASQAYTNFQTLATQVSAQPVTDLNAFANNYLGAFNTGFHYAFAVAIAAMIISLVIFLVSKKRLPNPQKVSSKSQMSQAEIQQDAKEVKQRIYALLAVFVVVIFFWFSFHQNGLTLTLFAKDYTDLHIFGKAISAEDFQAINPFCVVVLTPIIMLIFGAMRKKNREPSTPRKIAIGMGIAALAYVVMTVGSVGLPKYSVVEQIGGLPGQLPDGVMVDRVTPWLLLSTYLILTVAELFISPLGLSFVSKVAPKKMQGLMQGCWLGATALGNMLLAIGPMLYYKLDISVVWLIFVVVCAVSMVAMLLMVNWLERVTGEGRPKAKKNAPKADPAQVTSGKTAD